MKNHRRDATENRQAAWTKRLRYRPTLENLECRITPATVIWDNGGDGVSWEDPLNWSTDTVPGLLDDADTTGSPLVEINSAAAIQSLSGNSMLYVIGSLQINANSSFNGYVNLTGNLDVQPGASLTLTFTSSFAGTVNVGSSSALTLSTDWFDIHDGASFSGPGWYHINGATATISGNASVENMSLNNVGLLEGDGTLTVTDTFNWQSGGMYSSGTLEIAAGATMNITGAAAKTLSDWTIENAGTINWTGGNITGDATINNNAGGLFDIQTDALLGDYNPIGVFNNSGTLRKSAGAGSTSLGISVNNDGWFDIQTGTVDVIGPFNQYTGNIDLAPNTALNLQAGATLNGTADAGAGAVLSLSGYDSFDIGAFTFSGDGTMVHATDEWGQTTLSGLATISNFQFDSGVIYGSGTIIATDTFAWNGGTMQGSGTTEIAAAATMTINGTGNTLNSWTLDNFGTINWTAGDITADFATINNKAGALFDIQGNVTLANAMQDSTLTNDGTLRKSAGAGTATIDAFFADNAGTEVQTGELAFAGGGDFAAGVNAVLGAAMAMSGGNFSFLPGFTFAGDGILIQGNDPGGMPYTLVVGNNVTVTNFRLSSGTVDGTGNLVIERTLDWTGGDMTGSGTTTIIPMATATISGANTKTLNQRTFANSGVVQLSGADLQLASGAIIDNTFDFQLNGDVGLSDGGGANVFRNRTDFGQFRKLQSMGTPSHVAVSFENLDSAHVVVETGTLAFDGSFIQSGVAPVLRIDSNAQVDAIDMTITAGTIEGAGTLVVRDLGVLSWFGGGFTGQGVVEVSNLASLEILGNLPIQGFQLRNSGLIEWFAGTITLSNNAEIENTPDGLIQAHSDDTMTTTDGLALLNNQGGFVKVQGANHLLINIGTRIDVPVNSLEHPEGQMNSPKFEAEQGTIIFLRAGSHQADFIAAATGALEFQGNQSIHQLKNGTNFNGAGAVYVHNQANLLVEANIEVTSQLNFRLGAKPLQFFGVVPGLIGGDGTFRNDNVFSFAVGTIEVATFNNSAGSTLHLTTGGGKTLNRVALTNNGTITWDGGDITMTFAATITNLDTFNINSDNTINEGDLQAGFGIVNHGTVVKNAGNAVTNINVVFRQVNGTLNANGRQITFAKDLLQEGGTVFIGNNGQLTVNAKYNINGGSADLLGGTLTATQGLFIVGTLTGAGTINGNVTNSGLVQVGPEQSHGTITINGNYTQGSTGTLELQLLAANNNQYDRLIVNGNVSLGGTLNVLDFPNFQANQNDVFTLLTFNQHDMNDFATTNFPPLVGMTWQPSLNNNNYQATVVNQN